MLCLMSCVLSLRSLKLNIACRVTLRLKPGRNKTKYEFERGTMIELPEGRHYPDIPPEKLYKGTIRGLVERIKKLYEAVYDRFGEEGLELIREVSADYGQQIAKMVKERQGELDFEQMAMFLLRVFNGMIADGKITEWTEDKVVIMVRKCPYPFTKPEMCAAHTTMEENMIKGINPNFDYVIEKCIPCGDEECWHVLKR